MTLPHPDRNKPNPWDLWPEHLPRPTAVRSIVEAGDEVRDVYRVTMPNGATHAIWRVINRWLGDYELDRELGDWTPYGLSFDEEEGLLTGPGSAGIYEAVEEWADQDRGRPCPTCRCSGRMLTKEAQDALASDQQWSAVKNVWESCSTCLGMAWIPHASV